MFVVLCSADFLMFLFLVLLWYFLVGQKLWSMHNWLDLYLVPLCSLKNMQLKQMPFSLHINMCHGWWLMGSHFMRFVLLTATLRNGYWLWTSYFCHQDFLRFYMQFCYLWWSQLMNNWWLFTSYWFLSFSFSTFKRLLGAIHELLCCFLDYEDFITYICKAYKGTATPKACSKPSGYSIQRPKAKSIPPVCYRDTIISTLLEQI